MHSMPRLFAWVAAATLIAASAASAEESVLVQHGKASYYDDSLNHKKTASGTHYDRNEMTAASKTLPLGSTAKVTNMTTGKSVNVRVTDRGPHKRGRIIDVSNSAAKALDMKKDGIARVKVEAKPSEQPTRALQNDIATKAQRNQPSLK